MKRLLLILLPALWFQKLSAQVVFCPQGAEWHYSFYRIAFSSPVYKWSNEQVNYVRDTVVGNETLKILTHKRFFKEQNNSENPAPTPLTYIKQTGDTVFFRNASTANNWQILYNFAALPGQGWQNVISIMPAFTNMPSGPLAITYTVIVDSVKNVVINSTPLKRLYARYVANIYNNANYGLSLMPNTDTVTIDERMGCSQFLFNFHNRLQTNEYREYFIGFLCYSDDAFGTKQVSEKSCDYVDYVDVPELAYQDDRIRIFPNPATKTVSLKSANGLLTDGSVLHISDLCGRTLKQLALEEQQTEVPVADLEDGVYLLSIVKQGREIYTTKLVKKAGQ